ncbi:MAG TPA: hypothetical protein VFF09_00365 [archaeon]|nr:hypothetical protein [archaeon]
MKNIAIDSSSLITISDSCLIRILKHLSDSEGISFIIPQSVYYESVEKPLKIKKFELNAVRIRDAVEDGYLKVAKTTQTVRQKMLELNEIASSLCTAKGKRIKLIDLGEAETLAMMKENNAGLLVIDERTTRMLIEEPENVVHFLERRHKSRVDLDFGALKRFRELFGGIRIVRSVELIALAYETGAFEKELHKSKQSLEAALYSAKFGGCAVSFEEINDFMKKVGS